MTTKDLVLVTGGSGFVGSAIVRRLLRDGMCVRVLVRTTSPATGLSGLDVERVEGDLRDPQSLAAALDGVRWLFHAAADYRLWARDPTEIYQTNVTGTRSIMEAARSAGVERTIYTSSVATLAPSVPGHSSDEACALREDDAIGAYKRSKIQAERLVEAMIADGFDCIIVNPSTPVGPFDVRPTPTGRIIVEAASGRMPAYVDTGLNMVHVDDVAEGHLAALRRGRRGEKYILGGQNATLREILTTIAEVTGRAPPKVKLPRAAVYPVALLAEAAARLTGREPLTTLDGLRMARKRMFFTSEKAERMLGYSPGPYADGIKDAVAWFRQAGYLRG